MRRETKELALAGMLSALSAALLCAGGILPLATYLAPILASLAVMAAGEECRRSLAWTCYASSALLGLLLCADREAALLYVFLGYYPLIKPALDRIAPAVLRWCAKLLLCVAATGVMYALLIFVFSLEELVLELQDSSRTMFLVTAAMGIALFFSYDLALARFLSIYRRRRQHKTGR